MSIHLYLLYLAILVYSTVQTNAADVAPGLLGVNLGQNRITAAVFNGSGPVVLVDREGSAGYKAFMTESFQANWSTSGEGRRHVLLNELKITTQNARDVGTDDIRLATITFPHHFGRKEPWDTVWDAARMLEPHFDSVIRMRQTQSVAMITYTDNGCATSTYNPLSEQDEGPQVLLFEAAFGQLRFVAAEVNKWGAQVHFERQISGATLSEDIRAALNEELRRYRAADVAAIILTTDDMTRDLSFVREILHDEYPQLSMKIKNYNMRSDLLNSVGAACTARQIATYFHLLEPSDPSDAPFEAHEEL